MESKKKKIYWKAMGYKLNKKLELKKSSVLSVIIKIK